MFCRLLVVRRTPQREERSLWSRVALSCPAQGRILDMLDSAYDTSPHMGPFNLFVQFFVYQTTDYDILPSDQVQAMAHFGAGFWIVRGSYDTLNGLAEDQIRQLIT